MRRPIYLVFFISLINQSYSQTYNSFVSDSIIENFISWEIENSSKNSKDQKLWKKRISKRVIHWEEALIGMIGSAHFPNSFENQYQQMIYEDKSWSSRYYKDLKYIPELFNKEDLKYLQLQFENTNRNLEWGFKSEAGSFKNKPRNKYYTYTTPLFNKYHTIAIIYKEFNCGTLCAYGRLFIYVKEEENWKLYKEIGCWVS